MLRVLLQILPSGDERRVREIGRLEIANVSELAEVSDYCWQLFDDGKPYKTGFIGGHRRKAGAWRLVREILLSLNLRELPGAHQEASTAETEK